MVIAVAFSPDGTRLATASHDGTVRITQITGLPVTRRRWRRPRVVPLGARIGEPGEELTGAVFSPLGTVIATVHADGYVALRPAEPDGAAPFMRLFGLRDSGWAAVLAEHQYRMQGDPGGRFWWTAGLCRFEPGEADGHGVQRLESG